MVRKIILSIIVLSQTFIINLLAQPLPNIGIKDIPAKSKIIIKEDIFIPANSERIFIEHSTDGDFSFSIIVEPSSNDRKISKGKIFTVTKEKKYAKRPNRRPPINQTMINVLNEKVKGFLIITNEDQSSSSIELEQLQKLRTIGVKIPEIKEF